MFKTRSYVVIIIVQFVLMALFLAYALVQRTNAIRSEKLAEAVKVEAIQQAEMARAMERAYKRELEACMTKK